MAGTLNNLLIFKKVYSTAQMGAGTGDCPGLSLVGKEEKILFRMETASRQRTGNPDMPRFGFDGKTRETEQRVDQGGSYESGSPSDRAEHNVTPGFFLLLLQGHNVKVFSG